jgi:hypothetical protein
MSSPQADQPSAVIPPGQVRVTVTTVRYDEPGGEPAWLRESTAEGQFDEAVLHALRARLTGWALHQVLGRVLARRPGHEQPIEYEGMFSPLHHLLILVLPLHDDATGQIPVRELPGLRLPDRETSVLVAAA